MFDTLSSSSLINDPSLCSNLEVYEDDFSSGDCCMSSNSNTSIKTEFFNSKSERLSDFVDRALEKSDKDIKTLEKEIEKDRTNPGLYHMLYSERNHNQILDILNVLIKELIKEKRI